MDIKSVYKQLTNVDIEQQKQIWDERGKGYYGEYLLFCELYKSITGNGKILMNLNVPVDESKTTEIDLILIHETGLYVFEIKHYKGTIYGKDTDMFWTQYFRTVKNSKFRNPMEQNKYHIKALNKLLPSVPIQSCIVFTSLDCDVRVDNSNEAVDVCEFHNISRILSNRFSKSVNKLSMGEIDSIFVELSQYSQMKEEIIIDSKEASFLSWVEPIISRLEQERQNLIASNKKLKKTAIKGIISNIAIAIACVIVSVNISLGVIQNNNNELKTFKQKFLHIDEIGNEYIDELNSYVEISNVSLLPLTDDAVSFTARISMANDIYGIALTEDSKYIVMTNSGQVFEYNVFGEHLQYYRISNVVEKVYYPSRDLAKAQFYGIANIDDVSYIKITGIELYKIDLSRTIIKEGLEIELYSKDI